MAVVETTPIGRTHAGGLQRDSLTWLAYLLLGYYGFVIDGIGPVLPNLRTDLDLSYAATGLHSSLFAVGLLVSGVIGDRVINRLGRRVASWSAAIGMAVGVVVLTFGHSLPVTLAGALLAGVLGSLLVVLVPAILSDRHGDRRSAALSEANAISSATGAAAPLLIGLAVLAGLGWRTGFAGPVIVMICVLATAFWRVPFHRDGLPGTARHGRELSGERVSERRVGRSTSRLGPGYRRHWLTLVLVVSVEFCIAYWATDYVGVVGGVQPGLAAGATTVFLLGMVVGRTAAGQLALRLSPRVLFQGSLLVAGLGFACFWATSMAALMFVGLFVTGLGVSTLYPLTLGLALGTSPDATDRAAARATLGSGIAVTVAPLILAGVADHVGIRGASLIVPVLLVAACLSEVVKRRPDASPAVAEDTGPDGEPWPVAPPGEMAVPAPVPATPMATAGAAAGASARAAPPLDPGGG